MARFDDSPRPPTLGEMYERSLLASREAWKNSGTLATTAPGMRHDAPHDAGVVREDDGVRIDVASIPKIADLYARHAATALVAWKNGGDGSRGPVSR